MYKFLDQHRRYKLNQREATLDDIEINRIASNCFLVNTVYNRVTRQLSYQTSQEDISSIIVRP